MSKPTLVAQVSYSQWVRIESSSFYYCQRGLCLQANGKSLCAVDHQVACAHTKRPFLAVQSLHQCGQSENCYRPRMANHSACRLGLLSSLSALCRTDAHHRI